MWTRFLRWLLRDDVRRGETEAERYLREQEPIVRFRDPRELARGESKFLTWRTW